MNSVTLPAFAKVNLYLAVLGKRPDGYHELLTLFERVSLSDELTVEKAGPAGRLDFFCDAPGVPSDSTNLAVKAALAFREAAGWNEGLKIRLQKRIPAGGGLGGGSSDAAAVLIALQRLSGWALPTDRLTGCARALGADVAFFAAEVPWGLGRDRGDRIETLPLHVHLWHLLVTPDFPIPTKQVYEAYKAAAPAPDAAGILHALEERKIPPIRARLFNSLEPAVETLYPEMARVKSDLETVGGLRRPMVSGSGSTVFALCDSQDEAESAAQRMKARHPNWRVHAVRTA